MSSITWYVGLDYHQAFVQVCVMDEEGRIIKNGQCRNCVRALVELLQPLGGEVRSAIEACNGASDLAEKLVGSGWQVSLAHPTYVHRLKQSPDKTDWSDARLLADLLRVGYLPRTWLPPYELRQLRHLVRARQQLVEWRRSIKLRVGALLRAERLEFSSSRWTQAWVESVRQCPAWSPEARLVVQGHLEDLAYVARRIAGIEKELEQLTAEDAFVQALRAMPGIGLITAVTLRVEWGTMTRFRTGKQLARFCGLTPQNASSGLKRADAGLIQAANPQLRSVLIEAAHRLMRRDERWRTFQQRLRARGKPGSVIAAAVANRWVRWLYHQLLPVSA